MRIPFPVVLGVLALGMVVFILRGQDYLNVNCGSGTTGTPYILWTGKVRYPTCLAIGTTLKVTTVNGHDTLDAIAAAAPRTQVQLTRNLDGTYTLPSGFPSANAMVFRNGLYQTPGLDYLLATAGTFAPTAAVWPADDVVTVVF